MTGTITETFPYVAGAAVAEQTFVITLADEVRYCGAGLDFVGVHWNVRVAQSVGLPHVVAHGPFVVAKALSVLPDPNAVREYAARFESPTFTPDDDRGAVFTVAGTVEEVTATGDAVVRLTAVAEDGTTLVRLRVVVRAT